MSATLDSANVQQLTLTVPAEGVWVAECSTDGPPPVVGARCVLTVLGVAYQGTCVHRGEFAGQGGARIVGGAGQWGTVLPAMGYHSDAGVPARSVVEDLAREAGETLAESASGTLGVDWSRSTGEASRALSAALRGGPWYVGADGLTYLSERPSGAMAANVVDWDPVQSLVILAPETSLAGVAPGLTITDDRLPGPLVAREIRVELGGSQVRVTAWCPEASQGRGRAASALAAIVSQAQPLRLWGKYRYRVFRMSGDRVEAQAVSKTTGLPDVVPVEMWPGLPGAWSDLTMGSECLVEFIEGDPAQPIVTGFSPKGRNGAIPVSQSLCGGEAPVARVGDSVLLALGGSLLTVVFSNTPVSGTPVAAQILTATAATGVIAGGSPKVKA